MYSIAPIPVNLIPLSITELEEHVRAGLRNIYKPGFNYAKAGVMLLELQDGGIEQFELNLEPEPEDKGTLMTTLDKLNGRFGKGTIILGSAGLEGDKRAFSMKQERRTPAYTTNWADIPIVRA